MNSFVGPTSGTAGRTDEESSEIERRMRSYAAVAFGLAAPVQPADLAARVLPALDDAVCAIAVFTLGEEEDDGPQLRTHAGMAYVPPAATVQAALRHRGEAGAGVESLAEAFGPACMTVQAMYLPLDDAGTAAVLFGLRSKTVSAPLAVELQLVAQRLVDSLLGRPGDADTITTIARRGDAIKVLLIDDEPLLMAHLRRLLRQRGFVFHAAESGQHGLKLADAVLPDAILVDKVLPDMDGIEVLQTLRCNSRLSTVPVIMLSGHADEEVRVRALRAGADDFVAKPFSANELAARIRATVRMAQARRAAVWRETELIRLRQSQHELRTLLDTIQSVRVEERRRLAREVHDQLGQVLTAAKIELRLLQDRVVAQPEAPPAALVCEALGSALSSIDLAVASVQNISILLRPPALEHGGLLAALRWLAADWQKKTRLSCTVVHHEDGYVEPAQFVAGELLRICQEALTNVARHAHATAATVEVGVRGLNFRVRIWDNGIGIGRERANWASAIGLAGMSERAASIRAVLRVRGRAGCGTVVTVRRRLAIP